MDTGNNGYSGERGLEAFLQEMARRFRLVRILLGRDRKSFAEELESYYQKIADVEAGKFEIHDEFFYRLRSLFGVNLNWLSTGDGNIFDRKGPRTPLHVYLAACYYGTGIMPTGEDYPSMNRPFLQIKHLENPASFSLGAAYLIFEETGVYPRIIDLVVFGENRQLQLFSVFGTEKEARDRFKQLFPKTDGKLWRKKGFTKRYSPEESTLVNVLVKIGVRLGSGARKSLNTVSTSIGE